MIKMPKDEHELWNMFREVAKQTATEVTLFCVHLFQILFQLGPVFINELLDPDL